MYPATREPTEAEAQRLAAIDAEIEAIAQAEGQDSTRIDPLSDERDAIKRSTGMASESGTIECILGREPQACFLLLI